MPLLTLVLRIVLFILFFVLTRVVLFAQTDTLPVPHQVNPHTNGNVPTRNNNVSTINNSDSTITTGYQLTLLDSLISGGTSITSADTIHPIDTFFLKLLDNPYFKKTGQPVYLVIKERHPITRDKVFYTLIGLMLFLAIIKRWFGKYFNAIFKLFLQPSFRQKQTREQLSQNSLPSFLLNLFFIFSAGMYIAFLLKYYNLMPINFWQVALYCIITLLALYVLKYLFLSFAGWVFNVKEATDTYIFIVFLINKIIGVVLVPFTFILAFSYPKIVHVSVTVSVVLVVLLYLYRYIASYSPVSRTVRVSAFHFILYIFAFELIPLLLIYKTLINYLDNTL